MEAFYSRSPAGATYSLRRALSKNRRDVERLYVPVDRFYEMENPTASGLSAADMEAEHHQYLRRDEDQKQLPGVALEQE